MTIKIIVARYNEDIEWTKQFPNVIIYNKGNDILGLSNEIVLNNVGREGHTYYKYICENYDLLDDYTIFLQGNPFDHSSNIIYKIHDFLINQYIVEYGILSNFILQSNLNDCYEHSGLNFKLYYEILFNENKENLDFIFGAGAQFIVSKNQILKHPKEFYQKIVDMLSNDSNPMEGHIIERFHGLILGR
jgi:hypothetical protein